MQKMKNVESKEINVKTKNFTNEEDDLIKKVTAIPKEHLATLAPVINDLVALVSKKVMYIVIYCNKNKKLCTCVTKR